MKCYNIGVRTLQGVRTLHLTINHDIVLHPKFIVSVVHTLHLSMRSRTHKYMTLVAQSTHHVKKYIGGYGHYRKLETAKESFSDIWFLHSHT